MKPRRWFSGPHLNQWRIAIVHGAAEPFYAFWFPLAWKWIDGGWFLEIRIPEGYEW